MAAPPAQPPRSQVVPNTLIGVWLLAVAAIILSDHITTRADYDQKLYHLAAIRQFVSQWPDFDFWHYLSATTPGYHLLMAAVAKFVSPSLWVLQVVAAGITAALLGTLGAAAGRRTTPLIALCLCMPFLCNPYVVDSGAFLLPDNLGWLGVLAILLIALRPKLTAPWMLCGGLVLLALVFVRQSHLWTAGLLWASAWLRPQEENQGVRQALFGDVPRQLGRSMVCILATLPAIALVALFWRYWGGPVPPVFQGWFHGANPSAGAFILATFGAYGLFFLPLWWGPLCRLWTSGRCWLITAIVASLIYSFLVHTDGNRYTGRRSGLWDATARFHFLTLADHTSLVMVGLAVLGAVIIAALASAAPTRQRLILLAAIAGYIVAGSSNSDLFQRYVDPFVLIVLALLGATAAGQTPDRARLKAMGPALLGAAFLAMTIHGIVKSDCRVSGPNPPSRSPSQWDVRDVPCDMPPPLKPPDKHFWP